MWWGGYVSWLAWEHLRIYQEELEEVSTERKIWVSLLAAPTTRHWKRLEMDGWNSKHILHGRKDPASYVHVEMWLEKYAHVLTLSCWGYDWNK